MKTILSLFALFFVSTLSFSQEGKTSENWELIWSDEFNYTGLPDPTKWGYEEGFIRNDEPQYYTVKRLKNARVENGHLIIEARKEEYRANGETSQYTSASINTLNKKHFKFGKIEMRAKFDAKQGMWPAFWMMGITRGTIPWPEFGEVDIMEYYRDAFHANSVYRGENKNIWNAKSTPINTFKAPDWTKKFHVYTAIWNKDEIKIYVDDYLLNAIDISEIVDAKSGENPFHKEFYLLLNLALGQGDEVIPDENLPSKYYVDYVRVYQ